MYSVMERLYHNCIDFNEDVDIFRRSIFDNIGNNRRKIFPNLQFRNKRQYDGTMRGKTK